MSGRDEVVLIASRLALAVVKLRELAAACAGCGGTGETGERFQAFLLTDDPRIIDSKRAVWSRARVEREGSRVEKLPCAAATLYTSCQVCADLRQVIETVGGLP